MKIKHAEEIIRCLPEGLTPFYYFKDRYAPMLLAWKTAFEPRVCELKKTTFGRLLNRPVVRELLVRNGSGQLSPEQFTTVWAEPYEPFLLTLSTWGGKNQRWQQTTRAGHNLVLQLNFSNKHRSEFQRWVKPTEKNLFVAFGHPVMIQEKRLFYRDTLAWARIDLDLECGEALIEEIQTDWLRDVRGELNWIKRSAAQRKLRQPVYGACCTFKQFEHYCNEVLKPYSRIWSEAMLSAAIWFIREELGIRKIWYHHWETGAALKRIRYTLPPRSLYTELPRRFCFTKCREAPLFLQQDRGFRRRYRQINDSQWQCLEV